MNKIIKYAVTLVCDSEGNYYIIGSSYCHLNENQKPHTNSLFEAFQILSAYACEMENKDE